MKLCRTERSRTVDGQCARTVRQFRNEIFHSSSMELEESDANAYLDDMIAVLQDNKELAHREDAQQAVRKLQDLKMKDLNITTEGFEEILRQIKEEMAIAFKTTEIAATKYDDLKKKQLEMEAKMAEEKIGNLETEKELAVLKITIKELESQMSKERKEKLDMEKGHADLKKKLTILETFVSEQKEEIATIKTETSSGQCQTDYEQAKLDWRKRLIEQYHKTLLQVPKTPLQPKSEKCHFNKIYIRPKITREIKRGKGEIKEVKVQTMSEMFTKNEVPQKSVYVVGDAGSGKTSFCKYLVNCWCLAHSEEHVVDNKNEGDSEKNGGACTKHGVDNENEDGIENEHGTGKHGGDNENEADNENQAGSEKHDKHGSEIVNEEHAGYIENEKNSNKHGGDYENRGDEKHVGGSTKLGSDSDDIQDNSDDLTHSRSDSDDSGDILIDSEDDSDGSHDTLIDSDDPEYDYNSYELKFNGVKEMKTFDFVFYIPLRQYQNIDTIDEMLQKRYQMKMLNTLLEEESSSVMILLDGLDEWSSENVPEHSIFKEYTIVTTSRPWKFHTLRSNEVEIEQSLKLKGFDFRCEREIVYRTVSLLNVGRHAYKKPRDCSEKLKEKSLKSLKQVPIMLQQLICLWFDGKLDKTSRCAIYTGMLEVVFTWNDMKTTGTSTRLMKGTQKVNLPHYLEDKSKFKLNSHFIYDVSQLAYKTLFNCPKNKSLAFDICMFDELETSGELRENCLRLGIITEDECPSLSLSEPPSSLFSFIHKSMQEFLAAVYIGINYNTKIGASDSTGNVELAKKLLNEVFQKCSTVNDILEQSNVVIMLCGLEPRLATPVSKYIYDTVSEDSRVEEYRRTISSDIYMDHSYITDIQKLMFESMKEVNAVYSVESNPAFYIGDLVIDNRENCDIVCSSIDQKQIAPDSVMSINVNYTYTENVKFTNYLPMFQHLEKLEIKNGFENQRLIRTQSQSTQINTGKQIAEINSCVAETIKVNTSKLKCLSFGSDSYDTDEYYPVYKTVVSYLPRMINLVAISMSHITMSHDDTTTFCNFLEGTSHLEQIHLVYVNCECKNQHEVNLSKHQQLHYLHLEHSIRMIDADTSNLEIFIFNALKDSNYEKIFDIITESNKLKELKLYGNYFSVSQLYNANITKRLVRVLPLLHSLSKLKLCYCRLTDNIIQSPFEMKTLKHIKLWNVKMSLTTWQKFVDSLPSIPHTLNVSLRRCYITGDGEEFKDNMSTLTSPDDAIQYAKDKDQLFHVKHDSDVWFEFLTKK
ncbi:uncharacterized protein LOC132742684 isoform X2 [Ruditapes philippinarum]|uniref:uncharacterized protein LOC132742684 isoform X2 n=1 Tax=Ruditapes philippinarum TaxID=129788 RepID=UPI00295BEE83|nr:uncharacterized protein LOC132742684 isoform X2 [Ruditapes philippinarum]